MAGVGKVGRHLVGHLVEEGADVVVTDVDPSAVDRVVAAHSVRTASSTAELVAADLDVYAPCALGGALDDQVVQTLRARVVCGAANNQLAHPGIAKGLRDKGVVYAPDFVVNAGGVIHLEGIANGLEWPAIAERLTGIADTLRDVFASAREGGTTPLAAAEAIAIARIAAARSRQAVAA